MLSLILNTKIERVHIKCKEDCVFESWAAAPPTQLTFTVGVHFEVDALQEQEKVVGASAVVPRHLDHFAVQQRHVDFVVEAAQTAKAKQKFTLFLNQSD